MSELVIPLTQGHVALVSGCDFDELSQHRWHVATCNGGLYARRGGAGRGASAIYMHRYILRDVLDPALVVDHINGNGLDNRRENLRVTTVSGNNSNQKKSRSASGFRGVYAQGKGYVARLYINNAEQYLGFYETAMEAAFMVNQRLDQCMPNVGTRNAIDHAALTALLIERREKIDTLIAAVQLSGAKP